MGASTSLFKGHSPRFKTHCLNNCFDKTSWIDTRVILRRSHCHNHPELLKASGSLSSKRPNSIFLMDPQAPSQPSIDAAYDNPKNPIDQTSSERRDATSISASQQRSDPTYEHRRPNDTIGDRGSASQNKATPSSLGYGARDSSGDAGESVSGTLEALLSDLEDTPLIL